MQLRIAQTLGIATALLAIVGIISQDSQLYTVLNIDIALDAMRLSLAVALLYVGFTRTSASYLHNVLVATGIILSSLAIMGMIDAYLWGLAPSGLTGFDFITHAASGIVALIASFAPHVHHSAARV